MKRKHTREAIKQRGEVFTPKVLVDEMLDKLNEVSPVCFLENKSFLDPACGNGNFLIEVLHRKMSNGISHKDALKTIYGVEICPNNTKECRERLLLGETDDELISIVENNIINADALDKNHAGWKNVGYMWENQNKE